MFTKNDEEPQCADAVWAEYHCRYDWRDRRVKDIRQGVFYPTRFAAPQVTLPPLTPQDSLVIYRARAKRSSTYATTHTAITALRGGTDRMSRGNSPPV